MSREAPAWASVASSQAQVFGHLVQEVEVAGNNSGTLCFPSPLSLLEFFWQLKKKRKVSKGTTLIDEEKTMRVHCVLLEINYCHKMTHYVTNTSHCNCLSFHRNSDWNQTDSLTKLRPIRWKGLLSSELSPNLSLLFHLMLFLYY